jgi:hypothetical protein
MIAYISSYEMVSHFIFFLIASLAIELDSAISTAMASHLSKGNLSITF